MVNDIKPIETEYNGYRFRSRLEARWAVFFDAMGIKYEYEPEGYVLQDGECYLPDFRLHVRHRSSTDENEPVYAEVKGMLTPKDEHKCSEFSTCYPLILLGNIPEDQEGYMWEYVKDNRFFSFQYIDGDNHVALFSIIKGHPWICGVEHPDWFFASLTMNKALEKARKARFEHGEKPNKTLYTKEHERENRHIMMIFPDRFSIDFTDRVVETARLKGYTLSDLIRTASLTREDFKPTPTKDVYGTENIFGAIKIARTLNVSPEFILGMTGNMKEVHNGKQNAERTVP